MTIVLAGIPENSSSWKWRRPKIEAFEDNSSNCTFKPNALAKEYESNLVGVFNASGKYSDKSSSAISSKFFLLIYGINSSVKGFVKLLKLFASYFPIDWIWKSCIPWFTEPMQENLSDNTFFEI